MKRRTLKFMACAAVMALTLSVTACGGSDSGSSSSSSTSDSTTVEDTANTEDVEEPEKESEVKESEVEEANAEDEGGYATLEEALSDPELKEEFEAQFTSSQDDGMSLTYEVSGNEFTYLLKIEDPSIMGDDMAEQLQAALDSDEAASIYQSIAAVLDEVIEQEGACTVTIHYLDPDGEIMAQKSFKAN